MARSPAGVIRPVGNPAARRAPCSGVDQTLRFRRGVKRSIVRSSSTSRAGCRSSRSRVPPRRGRRSDHRLARAAPVRRRPRRRSPSHGSPRAMRATRRGRPAGTARRRRRPGAQRRRPGRWRANRRPADRRRISRATHRRIVATRCTRSRPPTAMDVRCEQRWPRPCHRVDPPVMCVAHSLRFRRTRVGRERRLMTSDLLKEWCNLPSSAPLDPSAPTPQKFPDVAQRSPRRAHRLVCRPPSRHLVRGAPDISVDREEILVLGEIADVELARTPPTPRAPPPGPAGWSTSARRPAATGWRSPRTPSTAPQGCLVGRPDRRRDPPVHDRECPGDDPAAPAGAADPRHPRRGGCRPEPERCARLVREARRRARGRRGSGSFGTRSAASKRPAGPAPPRTDRSFRRRRPTPGWHPTEPAGTPAEEASLRPPYPDLPTATGAPPEVRRRVGSLTGMSKSPRRRRTGRRLRSPSARWRRSGPRSRETRSR